MTIDEHGNHRPCGFEEKHANAAFVKKKTIFLHIFSIPHLSRPIKLLDEALNHPILLSFRLGIPA